MKPNSIANFTKFEVGKTEMSKFFGGMTTEELIALAWAATPDGGSSTWTNEGDHFSGDITWPGGGSYSGANIWL